MADIFDGFSLSGKIAVVTGGSRGIGKAIAHNLAQLGAQVVATATTVAGAQAISTEFEQAELKGQGWVLNVADREQCSDFITNIQKEFSGLHVLVNNAGITHDNLLLRMKDEEWDSVLQTNLTGLAFLCKSALKPMMKAKWGRIINISSVVATMGNAGQCNYAAAKAGLLGFSKSLAREIASRNITVNVISPGFIQTDMTDVLTEPQRDALLSGIPLGRLGQVNDIAYATAFLASDLAGYITGENLHINGGMWMV